MKMNRSVGIKLLALASVFILTRGLAATPDWQPVYSQQIRSFTLQYKGLTVLSNVSFDIKCSSAEHTTASATFLQQTQQQIADGFGTGTAYGFLFQGTNSDSIWQVFYCYQGQPFFLCETYVTNSANNPSSAYMSPLSGVLNPGVIAGGDVRALFVPYDNGSYTRYRSDPVGTAEQSFEVSAIFGNTSRQGVVVGSVEHDTWKSGVNSVTNTAGQIAIVAFGGRTNYLDGKVHGSVTGATIKSPAVFVGYYSDWREGMEGFAAANAIIAPPLAWNAGVPFGWNAWGALGAHMQQFDGASVSDFFATDLQTTNFANDNTVYIGLDAYWLGLGTVETGLSNFVAHCTANNQKAGIYWNPFSYWGGTNGTKTAEGSNYTFNQLFLRVNGQPVIDGAGAVVLDPTHPGTKARNDYYQAMFKRSGFQFLKLDYVSDGAAEADSWYDSQVTTGIQAINEGLAEYIAQANGQYFISFGVSALFPHQYCNSRKIATDVFSYYDETERLMNAVAYGWWLSGLYLNDGDHIVLGAPWWSTGIPTDAENRLRVTSAVITGVYLDGDDLSTNGPAVAKTKAAEWLTNARINQIAKIGKSFQPVEGNTGTNPPSIFFYRTTNTAYLAVFNFSYMSNTIPVNLTRAGLNTNQTYSLTELWGGSTVSAKNTLNVTLGAYDAAVYSISSLQPFPNGIYKIVDAPGYALDDPNGGGAGTGVDQQAYSGQNQQWVLTYVTNGQYKITSAVNSLALAGPTSYGQLVLQSYTGTSSQLWTFRLNGSYYNLINVGTGQAMDDFGGGGGGAVGQWSASTSNQNQNWSLTAVSPPVLNITLSSNSVSLTWPAIYQSSHLEVATDFANSWTTATNIPILTNGNLTVRLNNSGTAFFRLKVQ